MNVPFTPLSSGTYYAVYNDGGNTPQFWRQDTSVYETYASGDWTTSKYVYSPSTVAGVLIFVVPSGITGGNIVIYNQAGGSPAAPGGADTVAGAGSVLDAAGVTAITVANNLNATVSSRAAPGAQMDLVNAPNATAVTDIQNGLATASAVAAIPLAVWNTASSALTTVGTIGRYLANLIGLTTQQAKLTVNNDGSVNVDGVSSLTQQNVRDAMTLAPTAGTPATGSIDADLATIISSESTVVNVALNSPYYPPQTTTLPWSLSGNYGCSLLRSIGQVGGYIGTIPSDRTSLLLTVKPPNSNNIADSSGLIQIKEGVGLTVFNGSPAANASWASLVVTDATNGAILVSLNELAMMLPPQIYSYDIKVIRPGSIGTLLVQGSFIIATAVTTTA